MRRESGSISSSDRSRRQRQRGQAATELAISSIVLLLILAGLIDLSRVFYFNVDLLGASREGARHGVWYDVPTRTNPYLYDGEVLNAVNANLVGAGLPAATGNQSVSTGCPIPTDGNAYGNPPYTQNLYPTAVNSPYVYLCYTPPNPANAGCSIGTTAVASRTGPTTDNCWRLGDLHVIVLMSYGLVTPILQNFLGNGFQVAANSHMEIQGKP